MNKIKKSSLKIFDDIKKGHQKWFSGIAGRVKPKQHPPRAHLYSVRIKTGIAFNPCYREL